jgi:hypothetical protein
MDLINGVDSPDDFRFKLCNGGMPVAD